MTAKLDRRSALLAILTMPAAVTLANEQEKFTFSGHISTISPAITMFLDLADTKEENGVLELRVKYKGKALTFTAAEIWEALQPPGSPRFTGAKP